MARDDDEDPFRNSSGDEVRWDDLSEGEQKYYEAGDESTYPASVDEWAANWERSNAVDWEPADDDNPAPGDNHER